MANNNPITARMQEYAIKIRAMVHEAYQEGIVIVVPEIEGDPVEVPPLDEQGVYSVQAQIPLGTRIHLNLKKPERVVVRAVVTKGPNGEPLDIIPSVGVPVLKP